MSAENYFLIHRFVMKIMALPFLPARHIQTMFIKTESLVLPNGKICELINYICQLLIEHPVFVPHCWTVNHITDHFSHNKSSIFWQLQLLCHSFLTVCRLYVQYMCRFYHHFIMESHLTLFFILLLKQILYQGSINLFYLNFFKPMPYNRK